MFGYSEKNSFFNFINRLLDVILLNILWLITCIPIVTIGAATTAAYSITMKMLDDQEGYIIKSFFKEFKKNFKKATILWILNFIGLYILYLDWQIVVNIQAPPILLIIISILSSFFIFTGFLYVFPLTARYENTIKKTIINSIQLCFKYFLRTIILLIVVGFEVFIFSWNVPMIIFGICAGPMILMYTVSAVAKKIFFLTEKG